MLFIGWFSIVLIFLGSIAVALILLLLGGGCLGFFLLLPPPPPPSVSRAYYLLYDSESRPPSHQPLSGVVRSSHTWPGQVQYIQLEYNACPTMYVLPGPGGQVDLGWLLPKRSASDDIWNRNDHGTGHCEAHFSWIVLNALVKVIHKTFVVLCTLLAIQ